jgi:superoxide oxidase
METASSPGQPGSRKQGLEPWHHGVTGHAPISRQRPPFDRITRLLHWTTAFLVLAMFATAWLHAFAEEQQSGFTPFLLQTHRSLGVIVWSVTAVRLAWRLTGARLPPFPAQMTAMLSAIVKLSEYTLYALLLGQPVTGLLTTLFGGRPFALLVWQIPPILPRDDAVRAAFHFYHELGGWTLAVLVTGHACVALFHHFALRDDVLACMAPGVAAPRAQKTYAGTKLYREE